jgi:hypothetical protein
LQSLKEERSFGGLLFQIACTLRMREQGQQKGSVTVEEVLCYIHQDRE